MSDIDPKLITKLFNVKKNQLKMLERRGYDISKEKNLFLIPVEQFADIYIKHAKKLGQSFRSGLTNIYEHENGTKIAVFYTDMTPGKTQLGLNEIIRAVSFMKKHNVINCTIISPRPLSPPAISKINSLVSYNIQVFLEDEVAYDPTEHFLVPKHIVLTQEEQREFLNKNNLDIDHLPIILSTDIIARYYGLRSGQVVKIERENMFETMVFESISYKVIRDF